MLVDNQAIWILKQVVAKNGEIELPAQGDSMFPYIQDNDLCTFVYCDPSTLIKGDVGLYYTDSGQLIAHRLMQIWKQDNKEYFVFKGDTNIGLDEPIQEHQIIGKLINVEKKWLELNSKNWFLRAWGKMIIWFPFISKVLRRYLNFRYLLATNDSGV